MQSTVKTAPISTLAKSKLTDYVQFVKLRLSVLVVFSAGIGYMMGYHQGSSPAQLGWLLLAGFLITGASNGLNQIIERESDKLMVRTSNRPVATGRMSVAEGLALSLLMGLSGVVMLAMMMNALSAWLGFFALCSYAFLYTPLKRISPIAVLIGAFPGALPVLIGYTAATGVLDFEAILLFSVQFFWQFPHFWAIAWLLNDDYKRAGIKLLPNEDNPTRKTAIQILLYTVVLIPISPLLYVFGHTGIVAALICTLTSLWFAWIAWKLYLNCDQTWAKKLMFASFLYLPLVQLAVVFGKI